MGSKICLFDKKKKKGAIQLNTDSRSVGLTFQTKT